MPTAQTARTIAAIQQELSNTSTAYYPYDAELHQSISKDGYYRQPTQKRPTQPEFKMFDTEIECLDKVHNSVAYTDELLHLNVWIEASETITLDKFDFLLCYFGWAAHCSYPE